MQIATLSPGTYVVAVSGGVDSMVLLDLLAKQKGLKLIVAHYDHGIRADSVEDRKLVQAAAKKYGLQFVYDQGHLGQYVSEAKARAARYSFLLRVQAAAAAKAIVTAHHEDDLLETSVLNLIRGTNRRGLSSLKSSPGLLRPLLHMPKQSLINYARLQKLSWREDSTNQDTRYLRNYVRHKVMPKFTLGARQELLGHSKKLHDLNHELDHLLANHLHIQAHAQKLDRHWLVSLPHVVAREVVGFWLKNAGKTIDSTTLERLVRAIKTYKVGKQADVDSQHLLAIEKDYVTLQVR
jgi:tRNA(Ile)-lysidine synthetase-like protein